MDINEALRQLAQIPREISADDLAETQTWIAAQTPDSQRFRAATSAFIRELAADTVHDDGVSTMAFDMLMHRASFAAVKILAQLEIAERQRLSESIAAGTHIDIGDEILEVLDVTEPDEHGMAWITLTSGRDAVRWDASFVRDKVRLGLWNIV